MKNIILFVTTILILNSCTKDNEIIAIPSSPTNLISLKVTSNEVILNWIDNSTNESGYQIERKSGSGSYINVGKTGVNTTTFSDNGLIPVTTYTYRVYAYNKAGSSLQYSNEVSVTLLANLPDSLTDGLLAYYTFSGNAADASGNNNHGTVNNAALAIDRFGNNNCAYNFSSNSWIESTISNIPIGNAPRTISIWTNADATSNSNGRTAFHYGNNTYNNRFCLLQWPVQPVVIGQANDACFNCSGTNTINPITVQTNQWNNFIVTFDGTTMKFYCNGVLGFTAQKNYNTSFSNFKIGKSIDSHINGEKFEGKLDDIGVWNRVLTQSEVTYLATH